MLGNPLTKEPFQLVVWETKLERIRLSLRSFQNGCSPVNRLPDETLSAIIRLVVFDSAYSHAFHKFVNEISHVCRRWRSVTVSDARLWSDIKIEGSHPTPPEAVAVYLDRSKLAPLSISLSITPPMQLHMSQWTEMLNSYGPRIQNFHCHIPSRMPALPTLLLGLKTPNVEDLTIACNADLESSLTERFLGGSLRKLRHLSLAYFTSWPSGMFANLATLDLADQDPKNKMSLELFLDTLDASPLLERLHINLHGPHLTAPRSRIANLPHLTSLELWHCETKSILEHIKIKSSAEVEIHNSLYHIHGSQMDSSSFMDFFQLLPNDLSRLGLWEPGESQSFELLFEGGETFRLNICNPERSGEHGVQMHEFLDESLMGLNNKEADMINSLLFSLQVQNPYPFVSELAIKFDYPLDVSLETVGSAQWRAGLDKFRHLERLVLHECAPAQLTTVLQSTLLPLLKSLEIRFYAPRSASAAAVGLIDRVVAIVESRSKANMPILELVVSLWCEDMEEICQLPEDLEARMLGLSAHGVGKMKCARESLPLISFGSW